MPHYHWTSRNCRDEHSRCSTGNVKTGQLIHCTCACVGWGIHIFAILVAEKDGDI